jgi:ABC-2 type transport system permease protein
VPFNQLPRGLQETASLFPLKWMAEGLRSAFLPDSFRRVELDRSWQHPLTLAVLAGWCVVGLLLCRATFRWSDRRG